MVVNSCRPGFVSLDQLLKSQGLHRPCPSGGHSLIEKVNNETMAKHTIVCIDTRDRVKMTMG